MLSGTLSARTHAWLADHAVGGRILLPGTAFAELAMEAARRSDAGALGELTLERPLVLAADRATRVQVVVRPGDPARSRDLEILARDDEEGATWVRHATGVLLPGDTAADTGPFPDVLPPDDAAPIDITGRYPRLAERGYRFGPAFQGLRAAWSKGADIYGEAVLPAGAAEGAATFVLHPALLDAALHTLGLAFGAEAFGTGSDGAEDPDGYLVPFSWHGVRWHATGRTAVRVRITVTGARTVAVHLADESGAPVLSVDELSLRTLDPAQLSAAGDARRDSLFEVRWRPAALPASGRPDAPVTALGGAGADLAAAGVPVVAYAGVTELAAAVAAGAVVPSVVLADPAPPRADGLAEEAHETVRRALALAREWAAEETLGGSRLVFLTRGAVAARPDEDVPDLAAAALWGFARSAAGEHPGRFGLLDVDGSPVSLRAVPAALGDGEHQAAIRGGRTLVPRLARTRARRPDSGDAAPHAFPPGGTVLITGGTGMIGSRVARHLAAEYGVTHLLLTSPAGPRRRGRPRAGGRADRARRGGHRGRLRRRRPRRARTGPRGHPRRASADRRGARGRGARRRDPRRDDARPRGRRAPAQGGRGRQPARAHPRPAADGVRALLRDLRCPRRAGAVRVRGGERVPRRPRRPPQGRGAARRGAGVGVLGTSQRHDRPPGRGRGVQDRSRRGGGDDR
ncbi:polyketide synthase dehydratase domain-containing protein [Actinomadura madurae]|nr:polyketide synthase dehydratase domain-containing protein [Actinomadura madurae]